MQGPKSVGLEERHIAEADFHDRKAKHWQGFIWYCMGGLEPVHQYALSLLGDVSGKILIEFGCGKGDNALRFAEQGARVYAFDISEEMVKIVRQRAQSRNLSDDLQVEKMFAERLRYPSGFADCIFGGSILHHTELPLTRQEVHRVLKPGGHAVFIEPLNRNPLINLFRRLTPQSRTPTERPMRLEDARFFAEPFSTFQHRVFYLISLAAFGVLPFRSKRLFQTVLRPLERLDENLLKRWPNLGQYAWIVVFKVTK